MCKEALKAPLTCARLMPSVSDAFFTAFAMQMGVYGVRYW